MSSKSAAVYVLNTYARDENNSPSDECVKSQPLKLSDGDLRYALGLPGECAIDMCFSLKPDQVARFAELKVKVPDVDAFASYVERAT